MKRERRTLLIFLLTGALLIGCLPLQSVLAQEEASSSYELSSPATDSEGVTTWDCLYFGNYWQNDTNGDGKADRNDKKEPIKWRVLSVEGEDAFLLADKNLDCQKYNETSTEVTWATCTLRSWLNGYGAETNACGNDYSDDNFLNHAFTTPEQAAIQDITAGDINNSDDETNTSDKIYLLSMEEAWMSAYGFLPEYGKTKSRGAKNTGYAKEQGAYTSLDKDTGGNSEWWLRLSGNDNKISASSVGPDGFIRRYAYSDAVVNRNAIRPALHIHLSETAYWTYAGKVTSEEKEILPVTPAPKPTESPAMTEEPVKTPEPTQTPGKTVPPAQSPTATGEPEMTSEPIQSPEPAATQTPGTEPTGTPTATEKPVNTPERTAEPAPTRQPSPSPTGTPAPTKSPAPDKNLSDIINGLGVSEETAVKIQQTAEELNVAKDTLLVTEQTILNQKTDEDIKGAYFARIQARAPQITQNNIKLSWNRVKGADGYEIYGNRCNTKKWIYEYKRMKTITNPNKKSFIDRKCKKGTYYKYIVRAYKIIDGKKVTIAASKTIHVTTTGGKNGNAKSVRVNKKKLSLKQGKKYRIRAKEIKDVKPLRHHREVSYESAAPKIATVTKRGVVKAKKKGKCIVYAYAQNGKYRKIKVKVK